ncbi:AP2/ERF and B3 domain-containing transcription factor At1g50680-like [Typha angustifolia]|uniref:AP2/ERF and B3 domain-containing transcription factor At1g50680-like n=1 Tax=Typha angustifolia TaxID=59011 RepID=UPI003C2CBF41
MACNLALFPLKREKQASGFFPSSMRDGIACREMFNKELTPSDVGKLNRLVIPKRHAMRYFPKVAAAASREFLVEIRDRDGRAWSFRCCYWKSSQSYVFTKGWNKFVKEKGLQAKDVVRFYQFEEMEGVGRRQYYLVDVLRRRSVKKEEVMARMVEEGGQEKEEVKLFGVVIG